MVRNGDHTKKSFALLSRDPITLVHKPNLEENCVRYIIMIL